MILLDKLNPYMLYIKLALVAAVLASAGYGGWHLRGWKDDAARKAESDARVVELQGQIDDFVATQSNRKILADAQREGYTKQITTLAAKNRQLEEDLKNANLNTVTPAPGAASVPADLPFNHEFVLRWNQPLRDLVEAGVMSDPGLDLPPADTTVARVTREDLLRNHKQVVGLYGDCKVKQNKILEFYQTKTPAS